MLEILQFVFSGFWTWLGSFFMLGMVTTLVSEGVRSAIVVAAQLISGRSA